MIPSSGPYLMTKEEPGGFQETLDDEKDKCPYPLYKYHLHYLRCRMYLTSLHNTAQSSAKTGLETKKNVYYI